MASQTVQALGAVLFVAMGFWVLTAGYNALTRITELLEQVLESTKGLKGRLDRLEDQIREDLERATDPDRGTIYDTRSPHFDPQAHFERERQRRGPPRSEGT